MQRDSSLLVVGAAIARGKKCLVTQRGPGMSLAGKWEFPGGKVESNESPRAALAREIVEELGLRISVGELLGTGTADVELAPDNEIPPQTRIVLPLENVVFPKPGRYVLRLQAGKTTIDALALYIRRLR